MPCIAGVLESAGICPFAANVNAKMPVPASRPAGAGAHDVTVLITRALRNHAAKSSRHASRSAMRPPESLDTRQRGVQRLAERTCALSQALVPASQPPQVTRAALEPGPRGLFPMQSRSRRQAAAHRPARAPRRRRRQDRRLPSGRPELRQACPAPRRAARPPMRSAASPSWFPSGRRRTASSAPAAPMSARTASSDRSL